MTGRTFHVHDCVLPPRAACRVPRDAHFHAARSTRHAAGFSFTELLFAVMILGIGFILIAAIFPVGLAQTKSNFDETHAASLARAAAAEIGKSAKDADFTNTGVTPLQRFGNDAVITSQIAKANMISPSDPRYAWVALYRRMSATQKTAQLCVFIVNRAAPFTQLDLNAPSATEVRLLEPRRVEFDIIGGVVTLRQPPSPQGGETENANAAGPAGFLLVADDNSDNNTIDIADANDRTQANGKLNGRVYRLGAANGANWDMFPGYEFTPETFSWDHDANPATALHPVTIPSIRNGVGYIIGRNRTGVGNEFEGGVMDVAYYTTLISLK